MGRLLGQMAFLVSWQCVFFLKLYDERLHLIQFLGKMI